MNKTIDRCVWFPALLSVAINAILLSFYFLNTLVFESEVLIYIIHFLSEMLTTALPVIIAAALSIICKRKRLRDSFLWAILYAFINAIYIIPPIFTSGYETQGELLIILIQSLFSVLIAYIEYVLLFLLIIFIQRKFAKDSDANQIKITSVRNAFSDFSNPYVLAVFCAACARSLCNIILEIISTVDYFIRYQGSYRFDEIIYIAASYIVILASLFISHAAVLYVSKIIVKNEEITEMQQS